MKRFLLAGVLFAASAGATPVITVTPTLGPDFGLYSQSPNFSGWAANAMTGLVNGQSSVGSGVTGYVAIADGATLVGNEFIVTPFTSWQGVACPACAYGGEYGTAMYFGLHVSTTGTSETFALNQLSVSETYLGQSAGLGYPPGFLTNFGQFVIGMDANGNIFNSAQALPNDIALKQLWYLGVGFVQGLDPNATGTDQQKIDATLAAIRSLPDRTTSVCYSLSGGTAPNSGCGGVVIPGNSEVPEPGPVSLLVAGLLVLVLTQRRRVGIR